ncbi:MAG: DUF4249 domain-containing protein [Flavobacteriales bacterium]
MKKLFKIFPILFITASLFYACERDIDIDLGDAAIRVVVEGAIEQGEKPRILLTRSRGFFDQVPTDSIEFINKTLILDANITITDGSVTETMFLTFSNQYPFLFYTTANMVGEVGKTYSITIQADGRILTSSTRIPPPVPIDTTFFGLNIFDQNEDSLGFVFIRYTDPDTIGNAYRLFLRRNSFPSFLPARGSVSDDRFSNGLTIEFFAGNPLPPFVGFSESRREDFFFKRGDTIYTKFCTIGINEFNFFNTLEVAVSSNGNPFAVPVLIKSNIKGEGGLGVWCGYGVTFDTTIAQ